MTEHLSDDYIHRQIPEPILLAVARQREAMRRNLAWGEQIANGIADVTMEDHKSASGYVVERVVTIRVIDTNWPQIRQTHLAKCVAALACTADATSGLDLARRIVDALAYQLRWLEDIIRREPGIARILPGSLS